MFSMISLARAFHKIIVQKTSQKLNEDPCYVFILLKNLILAFFCKFCEVFWNIVLSEHLRVTKYQINYHTIIL